MTTRANTSQLPLILAVLTILGGFGGAIWGGAQCGSTASSRKKTARLQPLRAITISA